MKRSAYPSWVIVGAPKCGTTSLARYLGAHPCVWIPPRMKEPRYYLFDESVPDDYRQVCLRSDYLALFEEGHRRGLLCGEASAAYLFSAIAIPHLMIDNHACRIIVMVRNPLEMAPSLHAQKLHRSGEEHIPDFGTAWKASPERALGRLVRPQCDYPGGLDYQSICLLGEQLARAMEVVPRPQLHVIVHDDLQASPRQVWLDTLAFLGLPDDGRTEFNVHNARRRSRFPLALRALKLPVARAVKRRLKGWFPDGSHALGLKFRRAISEPVKPAPIDPELRAEMVKFYKDDVALLGELLRRDLNHWLA
jgi:hypothetical protein